MLINKLGELTVDRNQLQERIEKSSQKHESVDRILTRIDQWQESIIEKVKKAAEMARQQVMKIANSKREEIKTRFETLSRELKDLLDTEDVLEHDLERLKQCIRQIQEDLERTAQSPAIQLNTTKSDQIAWENIIYAEGMKKSENQMKK